MNIQSYLFNNLFIITTSPAVLAVAVQAVGSIIYSGNPANLAIQQYHSCGTRKLWHKKLFYHYSILCYLCPMLHY